MKLLGVLNKVKVVASILLIVWIYQKYAGAGLLVFLGVAVVVVLIRRATNWGQFMAAMRQVEIQIWGQPLDKIYGKPPKLKFKWRKNGKKD